MGKGQSKDGVPPGLSEDDLKDLAGFDPKFLEPAKVSTAIPDVSTLDMYGALPLSVGDLVSYGTEDMHYTTLGGVTMQPSDCGTQMQCACTVSPNANDGLIEFEIRRVRGGKGNWIAPAKMVHGGKLEGLTGDKQASFWAESFEVRREAKDEEMPVFIVLRPGKTCTFLTMDKSAFPDGKVIAAFLSEPEKEEDEDFDLDGEFDDVDSLLELKRETGEEITVEDAANPRQALKIAEKQLDWLRREADSCEKLGDKAEAAKLKSEAVLWDLQLPLLRSGAMEARLEPPRRKQEQRLRALEAKVGEEEKNVRKFKAEAIALRTEDKAKATIALKRMKAAQAVLDEARPQLSELREKVATSEVERKARVLFARFDADNNGHWSGAEASAAGVAVGQEEMPEDSFQLVCEHAGVDASKGLPFEAVLENYRGKGGDSVLDAELQYSACSCKLKFTIQRMQQFKAKGQMDLAKASLPEAKRLLDLQQNLKGVHEKAVEDQQKAVEEEEAAARLEAEAKAMDERLAAITAGGDGIDLDDEDVELDLDDPDLDPELVAQARADRWATQDALLAERLKKVAPPTRAEKLDSLKMHAALIYQKGQKEEALKLAKDIRKWEQQPDSPDKKKK
eukprot:Hpha_TRINITY_DN15873_c1_g4::TRINITY_DN15873_c1_g4_i1::g.189776::m.189776